MLGVVLLGMLCGGFVLYYWHRALPGQTINGHAVGGKTYQELVAVANSQTTARFAIHYGTTTVTASAKDVGLHFLPAVTAQNVLQHHGLRDLFARHDFSMMRQIDSRQLATYVSASFASVKLADATEPTLHYDASQHTFGVAEGTVGQSFDVQNLAARLETITAYPPDDTVVPLYVTLTGASSTMSTAQARALAQQATERAALPLTFSDDGTVRYTLQPDDTAQWFGLSQAGLVYNAAAITQTLSAVLGPRVDQAAQNQTVSSGVVVQTGHAGRQISGLDTLTVQVEDALKANKVANLTIHTAATAFSTTTLDPNCLSNSSGKLILVSIRQQHLWACDGQQLASDTAVTTGASALTTVDDATPTGTWAIYAKKTSTYLNGSDANGSWHDFVNYWMPFDGAVGFHDATWQTFAFGSGTYTTEGSHGCVHLPLDAMKWLYSWSNIGTKVTVTS